VVAMELLCSENVAMRFLGCSMWFLGSCYVVAEVF